MELITTIQHATTDKFTDPAVTLDGSPRARVTLNALDTLWFNTGTLCNLSCANCYIESTPTNDRLVYLTVSEIRAYIDEIARDDLPVRQVGFYRRRTLYESCVHRYLGNLL